MTSAQLMAERVRETSVLVEFSDIPLEMTLAQWRDERATAIRAEIRALPWRRRVARKLGLI